MYKYSYNGPVIIFDRCVASNWKAETIAQSESKAKSNLIFQYKKKNNLIPATRVNLPGKIEMKGEI